MFDATTMPGAGNSADLRQIFEREAVPHLDALYATAMRLTHDDDEARDLIQETMLRALRFFHRFTPGTNCRGWLLTILRNNFHNRWRRSGRERLATNAEEFDLEIATENLGVERWKSEPERILCARSVGGAIGAALDTLPEDFRTALMLVDVREMNYEEAVGVLGVPVGTIKSRVSRGRAMMRHALGRFALGQGVRARRPKLRYTIRAASSRRPSM